MDEDKAIVERGLIGSVLIVNQEYHALSPMLEIEMFTSVPRRCIWRAIRKLADAGGGFDAVRVFEFCKIQTIGQDKYYTAPYQDEDIKAELLACLNTVPHAAHAKYYAEIVAGIRE
jgi:replicative DNA helicase